jgi:hypothetical protein
MSNLLDRVLETTATTGTGAYSLAGAATGFRTFVAGMADSHVVGSMAFYFAFGAPGGPDANSWEFGYGTVTDASPDTLTRTVLGSSTGAAIAWSSGTKYIMSTPPAALLMRLCRPYRGTSVPAWLPSGSLWIDTAGGVTALLLKYYDGTDSFTIGLINETANTFAPYSGGVPLTSTFAQLAAANTFTQPQTVQASISATGADSNFAAGGNRALMDVGGGMARVGAVNGGGSNLDLSLIARNSNVMTLATGARVGTTSDPGAGSLGVQNNYYQAGNKIQPVLQRIVVVDATFTGIAATTPAFDDTLPQITEGTQIFAQAITARIASSTIRARSVAYVSQATGNNAVVASMFVDSGADAVSAGVQGNIGTGSIGNAIVEHDYGPGNTAAHTIAVRVGGNSASAVNGTTSAGARRFGGALRSFLELTEIAA